MAWLAVSLEMALLRRRANLSRQPWAHLESRLPASHRITEQVMYTCSRQMFFRDFAVVQHDTGAQTMQDTKETQYTVDRQLILLVYPIKVSNKFKGLEVKVEGSGIGRMGFQCLIHHTPLYKIKYRGFNDTIGFWKYNGG